MSLSAVFIRRPVGTSLLAFGLAFCGLLALFQLPVSSLPEVDFPTIVVQTLLPGANSETMATTVTTPLERQLGQIPSVRQMLSTSSFGTSQITLQFDMSRAIDAAEQDVQAAINAASNLLPKTLPTPPTYSKSNPADAPIMTLAVRSDAMPLKEVHDFADSILAQKLSTISGVGLVTLSGSQKPAVRVQADPDALASRQITLEDLRASLVAAHVHAPKGTLEGRELAWAIDTDDQLVGADAFARMVVAVRDGVPVRLRDVARVVDGVENQQLAAWADGQPAVLVQVQRQPGVNALEVASSVRKLVDEMSPSIPQGISVTFMSDRTELIRSSMWEVGQTLLLTMLLVVGVIYLFLKDGRATLIPALCVPLSMLATCCLMYAGGLGLDNLSLMALTVATGFVVDDAIVMVENIARRLEEGRDALEASLLGAREITFTIISLTLSLIAVLLPLLLMQGVLGRLFRAFSIVLAAAIVSSAVLSLSLTPMMCRLLLRRRPEHQRVENKAEKGIHRLLMWDRVVAGYEASLKAILSRPKMTLLFAGLTMVVTGLVAWHIPKGFFPAADTGMLLGITEAPPDVSFARMAQMQQRAADHVGHDPDVEHVASFIGSDGINPTPNVGRLVITLKPFAERRTSQAEVMARLSAHAQDEENLVSMFLQPIRELQLDNRVGRSEYQFVLEAGDPELLDLWVPRVSAALQHEPTLRDVTHDQGVKGPVLQLALNRDNAARLGVTTQMVDDTLYDAFGQRFVTTTFTQLNQYRVILELNKDKAQRPEDVLALRLGSTTGSSTWLSNVASLSYRQAPLSISHQGQFPAATLAFNVAPPHSLGQATRAIEKTVKQLGLPLSVRADFAGSAKAFDEALDKEIWLILAAIAVVYVVLGVLYENLIHPLTILTTLPSAGLGALIALVVARLEFNMMALIGMILLIGIVKKNAIMMIDFALVAERAGAHPEQAIFDACLIRFRPIMMTTLAALFGAVPLAVSSGPGSELRRPLGIAIVGGLLVSQLLTLYTTPVIYLAMHRLSQFFRRTPIDHG